MRPINSDKEVWRAELVVIHAERMKREAEGRLSRIEQLLSQDLLALRTADEANTDVTPCGVFYLGWIEEPWTKCVRVAGHEGVHRIWYQGEEAHKIEFEETIG